MDRIEVLRAYVRVVERGSFTAVAEELRVKQSTVSKWMASLEEEVGLTLLERTTRAQRVSDAGQRFYERAIAIVDAYDEAVGEARQQSPELRGRIRMSLPVVFGNLFVVPQVTKFLRRHKNVHIEMVFGDRYVNLVDEGFDVSIRVGVQVDSSLRSHFLGDSERRLVASPGYVKQRGTPVTPKDLERHECLVHTGAAGQAMWSFSRGEHRHRVSVRGRVAANNSEATLQMARSGLGVCLLASWLVDTDLRSGRLIRLLENYDAPPASIRALTPPARYTPPRVRALIAYLRESFSQDTASA